MESTLELRQRRAALVAEASQILELASTESRAMSGEESEKFDKLHADVDAIGKTIEAREKQDDAERRALATIGAAAENAGLSGRQESRIVTATDEYREAFDSFLRRGVAGMDAEQRTVLQSGFNELRDQSVGTGSAGGYLVPQDFANRLIEAQKAFGGMRDVSFVLRTASGADLPVPQDDDTGQTGAILSENTAASAQDVAFTSTTLKAYMYTSKIVKVSYQLLQDSAFDLNTYLSRKLGTRIGRITNTHFTTGTGSSQPNGVVTAATSGKAGATGQTTTVIYNDLIDLQHSVDPAYQINGTWMFADSTLKALKKLVDGQSRPLWLPGLAVKEPDTILGRPYVVNQDVAAMAASAKSILFGDFSNYWIRDVTDTTVLRLTERYADALQVGFIAFSRHDGNLIDAGTHPIKYYQNSAS